MKRFRVEPILMRKRRFGWGVCWAEPGFHPTIIFAWFNRRQLLIEI